MVDSAGLQFNSASSRPASKIEEIVGEAAHDPTITDATMHASCIAALEKAGHDVTIFPDAEAFIQRQLIQAACQSRNATRFARTLAQHPLRTELLNAELLPYQLDGIAFAAGAGRAILADDMGLGKTIQGIGVGRAARTTGRHPTRAGRLPRFAEEPMASGDCHVRGPVNSNRPRQRRGTYRAVSQRNVFTICNYEQVLRDLSAIEDVPWDLIILDEGQRIKNWESKTSNVIRQLESPFRLVLSGTPLENRLGELFTVARFVDDDLLGPAYHFFQPAPCGR